MRHPYVLALLLALGWPLASHAQQPFEQLGVKVDILSLTHGRFPEYFANDSLRRIGSVVYDTRRERVAYLLPPDSLEGRMESEITARWVSPDPLAEEDAHLSPYVFAANNAVRYNDPDGRKVIYGAGATPEFRKQFAASVQYMNAHHTSGMLAGLQSSEKTYYIAPGSKTAGPNFDPKTNTIHWDPKTGAIFTNKNKIHLVSPTVLLNHEIDHANQHDKNPAQQKKDGNTPDAQYENKEERRVITGSEQETAHQLGEVPAGEATRTDHAGALFEMKSSTSNELAESAGAQVVGHRPAPQPQQPKQPEKKQ